MRKLRVLDLFSGIGGFSLGLERTGGFETAAFCEYAEFPRKVLAKHWPDVPCFPDVRELKGSDIDGPIDVICGGYPCQPFSTAGQRRGKEDDRHLWPEFCRLVDELRPAWVIGENVAGHISMGLDDVLSDLERQDYAARTFVIPACATDAPHRRDRVWTVAHATQLQRDGGREHSEQSERQVPQSGKGSGSQHVADADSERSQRYGRPPKTGRACGERQGDFSEVSGAISFGNTDSATQHELPSEGHDAGEGQFSFFDGQAGHVAHASGVNAQGQQSSGADTQKQAQPRERSIGSRSYGVGRGRPKPGMGGMADGLPAGMDGHCKWPDEPDIGRVAIGVKNRANRLKALGNAVVPQIPEMIGRAILRAEREG